VSAAAFRQKLRDDLKAAMRERNTADVRLLRALGAAMDNAEAVPVEAVRSEDPGASDDRPHEVSRRELSQDEIGDLLARERSERLSAAGEFAQLGQAGEAERLRQEAAKIARYTTGA
jgi:uncharacterized protein YqeY